jgi:hypothetical protein
MNNAGERKTNESARIGEADLPQLQDREAQRCCPCDLQQGPAPQATPRVIFLEN